MREKRSRLLIGTKTDHKHISKNIAALIFVLATFFHFSRSSLFLYLRRRYCYYRCCDCWTWIAAQILQRVAERIPAYMEKHCRLWHLQTNFLISLFLFCSFLQMPSLPGRCDRRSRRSRRSPQVLFWMHTIIPMWVMPLGTSTEVVLSKLVCPVHFLWHALRHSCRCLSLWIPI